MLLVLEAANQTGLLQTMEQDREVGVGDPDGPAGFPRFRHREGRTPLLTEGPEQGHA